jgi:neutral ceramidase
MSNAVGYGFSHRFFCAFLSTLLFLFCGSVIAATHDAKQCQANSTFNIGAGVYDVTGPAAEEGMMGYAMLSQQTAGISQRLWARAFVVESPCNGKRVVFVNTDLCMVFQAVKQQVMKKLHEKYGNLYNDENVVITATHTHSGPGGFSTYTLYNLSTYGFNQDHFDTVVNGIVNAIDRAQHNMKPAQIKLADGQLTGISYSRSPTSYLQNSEAERARYNGDIDTKMVLARFDDLKGQPIGTINWFPIHGVSFNNKNLLISGDNKGLAEYLFEKDFNSDYGPSAFVAAFAQENAGDVSPNKLGVEGGEGLAGLNAVEKAARPQYEKAKELFNSASTVVSGGVDYRHMYVAMDDVTVSPEFTNGQPQKTCAAAVGISMLAGTTDGEGVGVQGATCDTIKKTLPDFVCVMTTTSCQGAKPIAVETGTKKPYAWTPNILPLQIVKIGSLVIVATPTEITTMSGRRIMETVAKYLPNTHVVLSGLSNAYSGYVATNEEYQLQRYEGASTHFGPWTLSALQQGYATLAQALANGTPVAPGPQPLDLLGTQSRLQPGVVFDDKPLGKDFGSVYEDVKSHYQLGDTAKAVFWGGHPKNNYHTQDTYLAVQHLENGQWKTIRKDLDWDTEYHWKRNGAANSLITIVWRIPQDIARGQYRLVHYGDWKSGWSYKIYPYVGYSSVFTVG